MMSASMATTENPGRPPAMHAPGPTVAATDRRADIVATAARLFDERGYHATSMEDLAEAVGLRKPSLYHYFSSKDEILFLIHDEFIEFLITRHRRRLEAGLPCEALLLETMGDILELMDHHRGHVRVFFEAHRELPQDKHDAIVEKRTGYQQMITSVIDQGMRDGILKPGRPDLAAQALFGMCTWAYQWYRSDGPLRPREIAYFFWDAFAHGLVVPRGDRSQSP